MLEEMRAEYDQTKEAFSTIVRAGLAEIRCREDLKARLREAGACVYRSEWAMVRHYNLDRLFLTWLCGEHEQWLYTPESLDHFLPASVMVGVDRMSPDQRNWALKGRDACVARCVGAIRAGWEPELAITFVRSKEEWASVLQQVGRVAA